MFCKVFYGRKQETILKVLIFPVFVLFQIKYLDTYNEIHIMLLLIMPLTLIWAFCVLALFQPRLLYIAKQTKKNYNSLNVQRTKTIFSMFPSDNFDIIFVLSSLVWTEATLQIFVTFDEEKFMFPTQQQSSCHHFQSKND